MRQTPLDFASSRRSGTIRFARLLSDVLSPPAVFAMAALVMGWLDHRAISGLLWAAAYGMLASLLPVLFVVYAYKTGRVSDMHMSDPEERQLPYLIGLAGAGLAWWLVRTYGNAPLLQGLILSHIVVMIGLTVLNFIRLISAHVASLTAIAGYVGGAVGASAGWMLVPVVGLMFYVRYYLKRHTLGELLGGLLTGLMAVVVLWAAGVIAF